MPKYLPGLETGLKPANEDALRTLGVTLDALRQHVYLTTNPERDGSLVVATQDMAVVPRYGASAITVLVPSDCTIELEEATPGNFDGRGHNQFLRISATTAEVAEAFAHIPDLPPIFPMLTAHRGEGGPELGR